MDVEQLLKSALAVQLEERDALLAGGAQRVGWKLGIGDSERIGSGPVVGYLTSATQLEPGESVGVAGWAAPHADVEIAVWFGSDVEPGDDVRAAIGGYGPALELVDLGTAGDPPDAIVGTNIFHRAFALGPRVRNLPDRVDACLDVNGEPSACAATGDLTERLQRTARILGAAGERLRAGDVVITGSIVQEPVVPGDELTADLGALGAVSLRAVA